MPWDWYEEQKQVADGLKIKMAGGEEEFGLHAYRWLIANDAFDILQPDVFYFGGMIRSMKVARMAQAIGKTIVPHLSEGGLGYLYLFHLTSACANADRFHEFKMFETKDANGTIIPIQRKTEPFKSVEGVIKVPTGSGLGIVIDPDYIKRRNIVPKSGWRLRNERALSQWINFTIANIGKTRTESNGDIVIDQYDPFKVPIRLIKRKKTILLVSTSDKIQGTQ